jgi:hypothetical protein
MGSWEQRLATEAATVAATAVTAITAGSTKTTTTLAAFKLARRTLFLRAGLVDREIPAFDRKTVQLLDGGLRFFGRGHADKRETAGAAREFVEDQVDSGNGAGLGEQVLEVLRGGGKRQIAHV